MWVTRSEREWRRRREACELANAATLGEANIAAACNALSLIQADVRGQRALAEAGFKHLSFGRSSRLGKNGRAEGLSVLEAVVVSRSIATMLLNPQLVRQLSKAFPEQLASLHASCDGEWRLS